MGSGLVIGTTNWVLIQRITLLNDGDEFNVNIPSGYAMIYIIFTIEVTANTDAPNMQFNDDAGLNYWQLDTIFTTLGHNSVALGATALGLPLCNSTAPMMGTAIISQRGFTRCAYIEGGHSTRTEIFSGYWNAGVEITKIKIFTGAEQMKAASNISVYGVI